MHFEIEASELRPMVCVLVSEEMSGIKSRLLYTTAEAADLLALSEDQLSGERSRGRIEFKRGVRNRVFFTPAMLDDYVAQMAMS